MKRFSVALLLHMAFTGAARSELVTSTLNASLNTGSLAGTTFTVSFSYDSSQVSPVGDSYVQLNSFDFTLLGVPFSRQDIFQGGQAIFQDGTLHNVTASFQVILPPNSPVQNITFGFGGPGVIGYIDLRGQFGMGSFTFGPMKVHFGVIVSIRSVMASDALGGRPVIEIKLNSADAFPVRDQIMVLQIGMRQFFLSQYPKRCGGVVCRNTTCDRTGKCGTGAGAAIHNRRVESYGFPHSVKIQHFQTGPTEPPPRRATRRFRLVQQVQQWGFMLGSHRTVMLFVAMGPFWQDCAPI